MYPRVSPTASSALVLGPRLASLSSPAPSQAWEGEMLVRWDGMGTEGGLDTTLLAFTLRSKTTELTNYLHYI